MKTDPVPSPEFREHVRAVLREARHALTVGHILARCDWGTYDLVRVVVETDDLIVRAANQRYNKNSDTVLWEIRR